MSRNLNTAENELYLFIKNESSLYNQMTSIEKNLVNKIASGKYDASKAPKLFQYLVENADKQYQKMYGNARTPYMLTVPERKNLSTCLSEEFFGEAMLGNFKHLLNKKNSK